MVTAIIVLLILALIGRGFAWFAMVKVASLNETREKVALLIPYAFMGVILSSVFFFLLMGKEEVKTIDDKGSFWVLTIGGLIISICAFIMIKLLFI